MTAIETLNLNDVNATWEVIDGSIEVFDGYGYKIGKDGVYLGGGAELTPHPLYGSLGFYVLNGRNDGLLYDISTSTQISLESDIISTLQTGVFSFGTAEYESCDGWKCIINTGGYTQYDPLGSPTSSDVVQYTCIEINGSDFTCTSDPSDDPTIDSTVFSTTNELITTTNMHIDPTLYPTVYPTTSGLVATTNMPKDTMDENSATEYRSESSNKELSMGWIIGIIVIALALCCVCGAFIFMRFCRRYRLLNQIDDEDENENDLEPVLQK